MPEYVSMCRTSTTADGQRRDADENQRPVVHVAAAVPHHHEDACSYHDGEEFREGVEERVAHLADDEQQDQQAETCDQVRQGHACTWPHVHECDSTRPSSGTTMRQSGYTGAVADRVGEVVIRFAHVSLGEGQRLVCKRCGAAATAPSARSVGDILAEIAEIAEEWDAPGGPNVFFEGFEPFAHPALPSLISAAADAGFARSRT